MNPVAFTSTRPVPAPTAVGHAYFAPLQLQRDASFSHTCKRCTRCCRHYRIAVTPFDLLRLADKLGISTTEVIARHLDGSQHLRRRKDGACEFLTDQGCAVHGGRPLVCRMYPLVRNVTHQREWFSVLAQVPQSAAQWGLDGTVAAYLEGQDALPSIEGYGIYARLHYRIEQLFRQTLAGAQTAGAGKADARALNLGLFAHSVLDPDPSIRDYCQRHGMPLPTTLRHKAACHVMATEEWAVNQLKEMNHDKL
ncbi:MAG: YkgJ family cysteine cluster protein [Rhodoferax sp.]|uniref:YkgJ family cysteine cluster protein n=1 Tax=Rhodoferax sp. TaxID=50421 RepID=UPI00261474C8|nr:YkgJ family cysteine cluster protein [Rhodoferax sp.]MDD5334121.1 YkgJ family cysteine cluster protein [Rhodoferax sp.]